jgi:hypothetical protein
MGDETMTAPTSGRPRTPRARRLSADDLNAVMALLGDADSTELKVTVPAQSHRDTIRGLPIDPVEAQPRQVFFFDTPKLALYRAGIVVRARRVQGGKGDTVVKLRPVVPAELLADTRKHPDFSVEVDILPGGYVCSASFKGRTGGAKVLDAARGNLPLRKLFSREQRAFFKEHAPDDIDLDALVPLGPIFLLKGRFKARTSDAKPRVDRLIVAEMWLYPDGSRILELSTKCHPADTFAVAAEAKAYLASRGVVINGVQQTKTKAALEYYSAELARPRTRSRS